VGAERSASKIDDVLFFSLPGPDWETSDLKAFVSLLVFALLPDACIDPKN
jgi:hypothetical protein